ncbi:TIGR02680 family protein [Lentzea sp. NPDC051838]|uniref:TIGR02680 family protein n=1 Tax=Lentzea sp. NPDC051838 TaxID=3154849 RepID=UPI0034370951
MNVWYYYDTVFEFAGGRMILRGTNGSGKSRALEMLLPFVLDADRRKMDATGSGKVRLEDLMRHGAQGQTNRLGYLWLELSRETNDSVPEHLTAGVLVRFSASTGEAKPWYFTTPLRVGDGLRLMDDRRQPLSRELLGQAIGADRITDKPDSHRERIASEVFGLTGSTGRERYSGLLQLLHTLRAPDVGNRIDEGNLPKILSDALPPLSENTLREAGERLDSLSDSREEQRRLLEAVEQIDTFLTVYSRYTARALSDTAEEVGTAAAHAVELATLERKAGQTHADLVRGHLQVRQKHGEAIKREAELRSTIDGIKELPAYQAGLDIENLAGMVDSLARAAHSDLKNAATRREAEADGTRRADEQASDLRREAEFAAASLSETRRVLGQAGMPVGVLPQTVDVGLVPPPEVREDVRCSLLDGTEDLLRPVPAQLHIIPEPLDETARAVRDIGQAAVRRAREAGNRSKDAARLDARGEKVAIAEENAEELSGRAEAEAERAIEEADKRDGEARALAASWRRWTVDERTLAVIGELHWRHTAAGELLVDADALVGDQSTDDDLDQLAGVADLAADPARTRIADRKAELRQEQRWDNEARAALIAEQEGLLAQRDPEPPTAPWTRGGPPGSAPLWSLVEFSDDLASADRAGVEAALLAAGLLSAAVTADGAVRAEDGQVLLTTRASVEVRPLTEVLRWDPASALPEHVVKEVLSRVGFGSGHHTWVAADGRWQAGLMQGKHHVDTARFIGASARAAARVERLGQIEDELADLTRRKDQRALKRDELTLYAEELEGLVRSAPTTVDLARARLAARFAAEAAARSQKIAVAALEEARRERERLVADRRVHQEHCVRLGLPAGESGLNEITEAAKQADVACTRLAERLDVMHRGRRKHTAMLNDLSEIRAARQATELMAEESWRHWHSENNKFSTVRQALGDEAEEVREQLRAAEREHRTVRESIAALSSDERRLDKEAGNAESRFESAHLETVKAIETTRTALTLLVEQVSLPGVAEAATSGSQVDLIALCTMSGTFTASAANDVADVVQQAIGRTTQPVEENGLMRSLRAVGNDLANTFDLTPTKQSGIWLVDLTDSTGRDPVAVAAARLREQAERAADALTEREHTVFTEFIISGVGEELRRRLGQADGLVRAMNSSLSDIRTSHGIGVRLRWELVEPSGSPIGRIRDLVKESGAVRSAEHTEELIRLLKDRVDESYKNDADAGYSEHLRTALDYRQWHRVEVSILGPAPGQVRKISRRAKLSQGETRFVSYVSLFAAADAYLSGLPDTDQALRLILLDDAFAKVDDPTIGELMGLLVRMDVDFCMTGHALWGSYPQVPSVDIYEVRRAPGTAAAATHVHWDGRTKHYLRSAG